jgi:hypothetical protein
LEFFLKLNDYWNVQIAESESPIEVHLGPLYTWLRAQRKEPSHWWACSFTQIHFTLEFSAWELEHFTRWHPDGSHVEWLQQALSLFWQSLGQNPKLPHGGSLGCQECSSSNVVDPKPTGFQAFLSMSSILLI